MSKSNQFRQYAEKDALGRSIQNPKGKESFIELARTWTEAAVQSERVFVVSGSPPEHRAA